MPNVPEVCWRRCKDWQNALGLAVLWRALLGLVILRLTQLGPIVQGLLTLLGSVLKQIHGSVSPTLDLLRAENDANWGPESD